MRPLLITGLVLLLSGCLDLDERDADADVAPSPSLVDRTFQITLQDCVQAGTNIQVPPSALASRLPQGFSPVVTPLGSAILGVEGVSCTDGFLKGAVDRIEMATVWTPVTPPENEAVEGARHYFRWHMLVSDGPWPEALVGLGVVESGDVTVNGQAAPAPMRGTFRFDSLGAVDMQGTTVSSFSPFGYEFVEFLGDADGVQATIRANLTAANFHSGHGVVSIPSGSWIAEVVGADQVVSNVWISELSLDGFFVGLDDQDAT